MSITRRTAANGMTALAALGATSCATAPAAAPPAPAPARETTMYGLISKISAVSGQRDQLIAILLQSSRELPGCLSYVVAQDRDDPDGIWVTEVWNSAESHAASLTSPALQQAIAGARPIIAGMGARHETTPVGGVGLA